MSVKNFDGNIDASYLKEMAKLLENIKNISYQMMNISNGDKVLDVGCGTGIDAYNMITLVGTSGKVFGMDNDQKMIQDAQKNYKTSNLEFIRGDAEEIPFPNEYFDAVRAERLFQVLPPHVDMENVLKEMIRVTKKGGRIVLIDTDWSSASIDYENYELTNRLLNFFANVCRPNGFAGRELYGLLKRNNLKITDIKVESMVTLDFQETTFSTWLTREALEHGIATKEEMDIWNHDLKKKSDKDEFFSYMSMILVVGEK